MSPRQPPERAKELFPLLEQRSQFFAAFRREAVVAACRSRRLSIPGTAYPAARLHSVEQRVYGGERELKRAARPCLDATRDFVAVQGALGEYREDGQFGAASFYA